jgi:hypothetical protein
MPCLCDLLMTKTNLAMYPFNLCSFSHFSDCIIVSPWLFSLQHFMLQVCKEKLGFRRNLDGLRASHAMAETRAQK